MDLFLHSQFFCSINLCICFCSSKILFWLWKLCRIVWSQGDISSCVLFPKTALAIRSLLWFQINFRIVSSSFVENIMGILIRTALNLRIALGSVDTVMFFQSRDSEYLCVLQAHQSSRPLPSAASKSTSGSYPRPIQMQRCIWAGSVPHNCTLSPSVAAFIQVGGCAADQVVPEHVTWVGADVGAVAGNHPESQVVSIFFLSFVLRTSKPVCALFMSGVHISHSPPASPTDLQTSQGDLSSQCPNWGPRSPMCGLSHSLSRVDSKSVLQVLTRLFLFPSWPTPCGSFLQSSLYNSLPSSLQFVFKENCSTCRSIFDVFLGGGERTFLLLQFLSP